MESGGLIMDGKNRRSRLTAIAVAFSLMLALLIGISPGPAVAGQATLAWDKNTEPDVAGYKLYYGIAPGTYGTPIDVGNVITYTVTGLTDGQPYFFAVTAYDTFTNESGYSNEVPYTIPSPEINLVGNGATIPDGNATPTAADHTDFGSVNIAGSTLTRTFTIQNTGSAALILSGTSLVEISGTNAADFTVTTLPVSPVAPGGITTFQVAFDPSATGTRTATISIANSDADENPYDFAIRGTGTGTGVPEIDILCNAVSIVDGDMMPSTADCTDFGSTEITGHTLTRTFTIQNTGSGALTLSGKLTRSSAPLVVVRGANAADFKVTILPVSPVAPGGNTTFQVRFIPSALGTRVASINIQNNDASENPYNFIVQAVVTTAPPVAAPSPAAATSETISKPVAPSGPTTLTAGESYTFTTHGAFSSNGDAVQYRFSWSDGTTSEWLPVGVIEATKSWAAAGTYTQVQVQARCANHPLVISPVSAPLRVTAGTATVSGTISRPGTPLGATSLAAMTTSVYRTGGAVSSSGDALQYRFHWSDGTTSKWLPVGVLEASKSWSVPGSYEVRAEARSARHPSIVSSSAIPLLVSVTPGVDERLSEPALPLGPGEGQTGILYVFDAGGASSSVGDPVQYRFQWGDGTTSDWVSADEAAPARAWKFWPAEGIYSVTAEARCSTHPELTISSATVEVHIVRGDPEMFFDTFAGGTAAGGARWQIISGDWAVRPDETFSATSQQSNNLAVVGTIPEFTAGRITTRLKLANGSTNANAGIIFSYTDAEHYRYFALTGSRLYLGQVGESAAETDGIKAHVQGLVELDTWHQLRVDIQPDGEVKVYFGQAQLPTLKFHFGDSVVGQVGCAANTSAVVFDDFGIWDERVLLP